MTARIAPGRMRLLIVLVLLGLWELVPRSGIVAPVFLASPSDAVAAFLADVPTFRTATVTTLSEVVPAILIACTVGLLLGLVLGATRSLRFLVGDLSLLYATPLVILYPLVTAWFGLGSGGKILFGAIYGLVPMTLTTAAAVSALDRQLLDVARAYGASRATVLRRVVMPSVLPAVCAGVRVGGGLALVGVIIGQLLGSRDGLGFVLTSARTTFDVATLYAAVLAVLLLAYAFNRLIYLVEALVSPWPSGTSQAA